MIEIKGIGHFAIPVSDVEASVKFYSEVVGCRLIRADKRQAFMDAGGTCIMLCRENPPVVKPDTTDLVHQAFIVSSEQYKTIGEHLAKHGVEIMYEEDREGGTVNGPRTYFRDPDGNRLEYLDLTSYDTTPG
ncbi:MAG: VOC family protein [Alphaproteobacteria bacterium]